MKTNKPRLLVTLFLAVCCLMAFSVTALAADNGCYASDETGTATPPDSIDSISISTAAVSVSSDTSSAALTPDGNLSLVDDILQDESNYVQDEQTVRNKQFITVQSKNGNTFYIVIDRSDDTENVYFLNLVDESDLIALMEDNWRDRSELFSLQGIKPCNCENIKAISSESHQISSKLLTALTRFIIIMTG